MSTRFAQIFWGLLLVILDFRINRIDLLPDFVGYLLVAIGCGGLVSASQRFSTASTLSWILLVLSLIGYALPGDIARPYGIVHLVIDCAMMWFLLGGVMELAATRQRADLFERASNRRIAYLVLMGTVTLVGFVAHGSRDAAILILVVWGICTLVLLILILHLIHRAKLELTDDPAS